MSNTQAPLPPDAFIRECTLVMPSLTFNERARLYEQAKAWATVYYNGDLPKVTTLGLKEMEWGCRSLMTRADG